jgi:predicted nucleotidyltransferase
VAEALDDRRRERERLIDLARDYVQRLSGRIRLVGAAVVGSVARGDFNVWSDVDVVVIGEELPPRIPDRAALLGKDVPAGVEPIGFTPDEFREALSKGDPHAREAMGPGVILAGEDFFRGLPTRSTHPS